MQSDVIRIGQMELKFLVDEAQSEGKAVMFEFLVPEKARVPAPHYHREVDEIVYGLDGTLTTTKDGTVHEVGRGDSVFLPRGCVHHHQNLHSGAARALIVMSPGTIGKRYFEEVAAVVNAGGPPDLAKIKEIMLRHGLVPA
jgi:quercetin dioxygenase-like cupin family protein